MPGIHETADGPFRGSPSWKPGSRPARSLRSLLLLVLCAFAFLTAGAAEAQQADPEGVEDPVVMGRILTEEEGSPVSGARITAEEKGAITTSDQRGRFRLEGLPVGQTTLVVERLGYRAATRTVTVEGGRTRIEIGLVEEPLGVDPIRIRARRTRMIGDPLNIDAIPGSAHFLSSHDLEAQKIPFDNVHEVLRRIPGVNVQEEEGYGLRPNIGLRGTGVSRTSKVTVMEDGVPIAPAPYAAPAAYYFPVTGRMDAVEVRKGSSQIRYGPRTVGGAINLVSAPIPDERAWDLDVQGGEDRTHKVHARAGDSWERFGWLVEAYRQGTDGFKELDGGGDTGFRLGDYQAKLRVNTDREADRYQELELKVGYHDETSDETYLGLTEEDFRQDPLLRYPASGPDVMDTEHTQLQLHYFLQASERADISATAYRNDFARNWYKLDSVLGAGIGSVLDRPEEHEEELDILKGGESGDDALVYRANNREYVSQGLQATFGLRLDHGRVTQDVEVGVRLHQDEMDRFQWEDGYRMTNATPVRTSHGEPGSQSNRIDEASAVAGYVQSEIGIGEQWTVVPGVRYENVDLRRSEFSTEEPSRETPLAVQETPVSAVIPGVGSVYSARPWLHLFGGVHKGFSPPGPGAAEETRPEESVNYELGARLRRAGVAVQATGFFSDYRNVLGEATLATGETGVGDLFNGGQVHAAGLETSLDYDLAWNRDLPVDVPVSLSYTWTLATFRNSFDSDFKPWGEVEAGDHLPYLPAHQLSGRLGLEDAGWSLGLSASASSEMRTTAGRGELGEGEGTDGFVVLDLQGEYALPDDQEGALYAGVRNLADRHYVAARRPAGARPGLPRTVFLGVRLSW